MMKLEKSFFLNNCRKELLDSSVNYSVRTKSIRIQITDTMSFSEGPNGLNVQYKSGNIDKFPKENTVVKLDSLLLNQAHRELL